MNSLKFLQNIELHHIHTIEYLIRDTKDEELISLYFNNISKNFGKSTKIDLPKFKNIMRCIASLDNIKILNFYDIEYGCKMQNFEIVNKHNFLKSCTNSLYEDMLIIAIKYGSIKVLDWLKTTLFFHYKNPPNFSEEMTIINKRIVLFQSGMNIAVKYNQIEVLKWGSTQYFKFSIRLGIWTIFTHRCQIPHFCSNRINRKTCPQNSRFFIFNKTRNSSNILPVNIRGNSSNFMFSSKSKYRRKSLGKSIPKSIFYAHILSNKKHIQFAVENGLLDIVVWFCEFFCTYSFITQEYVSGAARNGHAHILEWAKNIPYTCLVNNKTKIIPSSAYGRIGLRSLNNKSLITHSNGCILPSILSINEAAANGYISVLKWGASQKQWIPDPVIPGKIRFINGPFLPTSWGIRLALKNNQHHIIEWSLVQDPPILILKHPKKFFRKNRSIISWLILSFGKNNFNKNEQIHPCT
ncbi:MAG: hypothetical protein JKX76_00890 [Colwellia sp.]|nr:hypothetical protein [Colwellia sp.]